MNTQTTEAAEAAAPAATESKAPAPKTVADDMTARRCFYPTDSQSAIEQAMEYLGTQAETLSDFDSFPLAAPGFATDDEGETTIDESIYTDEVGVMVAKLTRKSDNKEKGLKAGIAAIVVAPIPNFVAMLSGDEAFNNWAQAILEKEANHVAVRPLREAADIALAVADMPVTVDAYTTALRGAGSVLMEAYDSLYKDIKTLMSKVGVWNKRNSSLTKMELRKCLESAAYAAEYFPALESWTHPKTKETQSLFVVALGLGVTGCAKAGLDATIFNRWLETRNDKPLTDSAEEEEDFDFDALASQMGAAPAADAADAAEGDPADPAEPLPIG